MIELTKILNNTVMVLQIIVAIYLLVIAIKMARLEAWLFFSIHWIYAVVEVGFKFAYHGYPKQLPFWTVFGNMAMVFEVLVTFSIFYLILSNQRYRNWAAVMTILTPIAFLLTHYTIQPLDVSFPMYVYNSATILLLFFCLLYLKVKLSIGFVPSKYDNFWFFIVIALILNYVTQMPSFLLYNFITAHYGNFSMEMLDRLSIIKYMTSCISYFLLIRACYEYR